MTRLELATEAARLINASDARLGARVVARNGKVTVECRIGRNTCEIDFPSLAKPDNGSCYAKLLCVKDARTAIDEMPAASD